MPRGHEPAIDVVEVVGDGACWHGMLMEVWRVHRSLADKQVIGLESPFRKHVVCSLQVAPLPGMAQAILFEFIDIPQSRSGGALARYLAAIRKLETGP